jgi:RNA polymerase sigma-70 factor (ECF subfamily)
MRLAGRVERGLQRRAVGRSRVRASRVVFAPMSRLARTSHTSLFGDPGALEDFVRESYPATWRLCAALVDEASADDLAQETFLRATRQLAQFRSQASERTWILTIARGICMDELRGRYRRAQRDRQLAAIAAFVPAVSDPAAQVDTLDLLAQVKFDRRTAFVLTQLLGLSYAEAALVCGCPTGTIRSRVARARDDVIALTAQVPAARGGSST